MNDRIQEIKRRLEAATPGTWEVVVRRGHEIAIYSKDILIMSFGGNMEYETFKGEPPSDADENLITWANSDIAYLLSEVERLQRENEAMKEALEWYADKDNYDPIHISSNGWIPIDKDEGERARTALSHLKG